MLRRVRNVIVVTCALALAGCGRTAAPGQVQDTGTAVPTPRSISSGTSTTSGPETIEPVGSPGTTTVDEGGFPSAAGEIAYLVDVRTARHDGFDRVVLQFQGDEAPSYRVTYVSPPIREDGSGRTVPVAGEDFLELRLTPASAYDLSGTTPAPTYAGPDRITPPHTETITELVMTGDFEANLAWTVGVNHRAPFAVAVFREPLRLVVDVVHG